MKSFSARTRTADWKLVVLFLLVVLIALRLLANSWHASLLDRYEFRQLQTAYSTYWMALDGWRLAYPLPLFGPPWSVPMEFPVYQVIVAQWHNLTGMPLEQSGRFISIFFLLATLPAVFDLLAMAGLKPARRLIVLAVILSSPVYLFYARTFMIETTALCFSVWFLAALRRSLERPTIVLILGTTLLATLAALTKITTFVVFGIPAVSLVFWQLWQSRHRPAHWLRSGAAATAPALVSLLLTWSWVRFSDRVKDSNPFAGFLTSRELHHWNFGTWSLRFDASFWIHIEENLVSYQLAEGAIAIALLCATFAPRRARWIAGVGTLGYLAGPLIFANLYHLHDYYYAANALLLVGAAGILLASVWSDSRLPRGANWLALTLLLSFQYYAFYRGYDTYRRHPAPPPPAIASVIRNAVPSNGVVLIYGADWNPLLPYYSERRAVMVPGERENETAVLAQIIARLPPCHIDAMVIHGDRLRNRPDFIRERAQHFNLSTEPFARDGEDELYLPIATIVHMAGNRSATTSAHMQLLASPLVDAFSATLNVAKVEPKDLDLFSPAPVMVRSKYGVSRAELDGHQVFNAHAPSELVFQVPAGRHHLQAAVGLPAAAFAAGHTAITDGITVDVFVSIPGGLKQQCYHRRLNPAQILGDRGPQILDLELSQNCQGEIILRLGNGPAGDPTNDWAYWERVDIH